MVRAFFMATSNTCVRLSIIALVSIPTMADNAPIMVIVPAKGGGWFAAAKRQEIAVRMSHSCCMEPPGDNSSH